MTHRSQHDPQTSAWLQAAAQATDTSRPPLPKPPAAWTMDITMASSSSTDHRGLPGSHTSPPMSLVLSFSPVHMGLCVWGCACALASSNFVKPHFKTSSYRTCPAPTFSLIFLDIQQALQTPCTRAVFQLVPEFHHAAPT